MNSVHTSATVHPSVTLPPDVTIEEFTILRRGVCLGSRTSIRAFALIGEGTTIGEDCSIGAYTEIRAGCEIGIGVRLGSKCLLADGTKIGDGAHCSGTFTTCNKPTPGEHRPCVIGRRFYAGVRVTILPDVRIGDDVQVGACSQVRHDIPAGQVWFGNPARRYR